MHGCFTTPLLEAIHSERAGKKRKIVVKFHRICEHGNFFMLASGFTLKNLYYGPALKLGVTRSQEETSKSMLYFFTLFFSCLTRDQALEIETKNCSLTCTCFHSMLPEQHKFEMQVEKKGDCDKEMKVFADEEKKNIYYTEGKRTFPCFNTTRRLINFWTMNKVNTLYTHVVSSFFSSSVAI